MPRTADKLIPLISGCKWPEGKCSNAGDISQGTEALTEWPVELFSTFRDINKLFSFPFFSSALRKSNLSHHGYRTLFHSYSSSGNLAQRWIPLKSQVRFLLKSLFFLMLPLQSGLSTALLLPQNTQAFNFCQGKQLENEASWHLGFSAAKVLLKLQSVWTPRERSGTTQVL